jgi:hypothetical protein
MTSLIARLEAARTAVLTIAGFSSLTASAWTVWGTGAGLAGAGASLLLLEFLSGEEAKR